MQVLTNFLDHGILPFVGRKGEMRRLTVFWEETAEARALRIALLVGEAGIGKSRLVQELIPRIEARGGVVVHVRLYPGAMTSLVPLTARAIAAASTGRLLRGREPEEQISSVVEGLQRLARLRPVLLVIEDIHLLTHESLAEFTHLLDALANESISVLCLTRPVEIAARQALERYLVEDIPIAGLAMDDQRDLWESLFSTPPDPGAMNAIQEIALGNPLALRSAFRGVLKSGRLVRDEKSGRWETIPPPELLSMVIDRNVGMMAGGLMLHLTPEEHRAATCLARLGEVFSREAAGAILPDAPTLIETLLQKGILATSSVAITALSGPPSSQPLLTFTHTVLHGHLVRHAETDLGNLVDVIAGDTPLYSVLPFQLVAKHPSPLYISDGGVPEAIRRPLAVAHLLDSSPDWKEAVSVWEMAERIFREFAGTLEPAEESRLHAEITNRRITLLRRAIYSEEFEIWTQRFLKLTENPASSHMAEYRLRALRFFFEQEMRRGTKDSEVVSGMIEKLLKDFPTLRTSPGYLEYLESLATIGWTMHLPALIDQVEKEIAPILADESTTESRRVFIRQAVRPFFLLRFSTPEGLRDRLNLLAELDAEAKPHDIVLLTQKLELLWMIGAFDELLAAMEWALPRIRQRGMLRLFNRYSFMEAVTRTAFGTDMGEVEERITRIRAESSTEFSPTFQGYMGHCFLTFGLLRGELSWTRAMLDKFVESEQPIPLRIRILLSVVEDAPEPLLSFLEEVSSSEPLRPLVEPLRALAAMAAGRPGDRAATERLVEEFLARPLLRVADIADFHGILIMIGRAGGAGSDELSGALATSATSAVRRMSRWLVDHGLFSYIPPLLDRFGHHLPDDEVAAVRTEARTLETRMIERRKEQEQRGLMISMLGVIAVRRPGEEPHRVRGARLCALLGAIVGAGMLRKPLSHRDFCRLASGENDPEYARKMMNGAVWRLRDLLGQDAVLTDTELPRLNPELVQVDLLMAYEALTNAAHAEREGSLMRAVPFLLTALGTIRGEVPFPGLYDPFFEAAREDIENLLRTTIVRIGSGLLERGDPQRAEDMLQQAAEVLREDEEIAELLSRALVALDRRAEANLVMERLQAIR